MCTRPTQKMKAPLLPFTITNGHGQKQHYCQPCGVYKHESEFNKSALARRRRCCKLCYRKKYRATTDTEKMLRSVRNTVAKKDRLLARRWELSDVLAILARGCSELSKQTSHRYSIVQKQQEKPFTPDNAMLVTRKEAIGKRHLCFAT